MFFFGTDANAPRVVDGQCVGDTEQPVLDRPAVTAAQDGYTRLSIADRMSGQRPRVGSRPAYPGRPYEDHR